MLLVLLCSDNVLTSVDIKYTRWKYTDAITITTKQKVIIKKNQYYGGKQKKINR